MPSILAALAAVSSFFFGAFLGFFLAITAIALGAIGMVLAAAPHIRGGVISAIAIFAGAFGILAAMIKLVS
jgi:hypothetical protein